MTQPLSSEDSFYLQYGKALDAWAGLEFVLKLWFEHLTGMQAGMARAVFYSGNSFAAKRDMLLAALEVAKTAWGPAPRYEGDIAPVLRPLEPVQVKFLRKAFHKVSQYSSARNSLAHRMFVLDLDRNELLLADRGQWTSTSGLSINHLQEIEYRLSAYRLSP